MVKVPPVLYDVLFVRVVSEVAFVALLAHKEAGVAGT